MIPWLASDAPADLFPPQEMALHEPNGLLAAGGDLSTQRLVCAYRRGIFPWYSEGEPILWWTPDPRAVIRPQAVHVSRRLARDIRAWGPKIRIDGDFAGVIASCAAPRPGQFGTWITTEMLQAYQRLFDLGIAHCAEALVDGEVVGGIYGLAIGQVFFGESMYTASHSGSKLALVGLCRWLAEHGYALLDGQVESPHLRRMGAESWQRKRFVETLHLLCDRQPYQQIGPTELELSG